MAISLVSAGASPYVAAGGLTVFTFSHTIVNASESTRFLVVRAAFVDSSSTSLLLTCTVDGVACTQAGLPQVGVSAARVNGSYVWYIEDADLPATAGTYDIVITANEAIAKIVSWASEYTGGNSTLLYASMAGVASWSTGTDLTPPFGDYAVGLTSYNHNAIIAATLDAGTLEHNSQYANGSQTCGFQLALRSAGSLNVAWSYAVAPKIGTGIVVAFYEEPTGGIVINRSLSDNISVFDNSTKLQVLVRGILDAVAIGSDAARRTLEFYRLLPDSVQIESDSALRVVLRYVSFVDYVAIESESLNKTRSYHKSFADYVAIESESLDVILSATRVIFDGISITDDLISNIITPGGIVLNRSLSDSINIVDLSIRILEYHRSFADFVSVYDSFSATIYSAGQIIIIRALTDSIEVIDQNNRTVEKVRKIFDEIAISDGNASVVEMYRLFFDGITSIVDNITSTRKINRSVLDSVLVTDSFSELRRTVRTLIDSVNVTDSFTSTLSVLILARIQMLVAIAEDKQNVGINEDPMILGIEDTDSEKGAT